MDMHYMIRYVTKDHLQYKRFTAQSLNTTYVYDMPEMFRQALLSLWRQYIDRNKLKDYLIPKDFFYLSRTRS